MDTRSYTFSLTPLSSSLYFKTPVSLDCEPVTVQNLARNIFPTFNNDGKHYTPAFVLPVDLHITTDLDNQIKQLYLQKLEKAEESTVDVSNTEACPPSQNKYCSVCRSRYENYTNHVRSKVHKFKAGNSNYKGYIDTLCDEFSSPSQHITCKKFMRRMRNSGSHKNIKNATKSSSSDASECPNVFGNEKRMEGENLCCFINDQLRQIQGKQAKLFETHEGFAFFDLTPQF